MSDPVMSDNVSPTPETYADDPVPDLSHEKISALRKSDTVLAHSVKRVISQAAEWETHYAAFSSTP